MAWLLAALIDIVFTTLVAVGTSWFFVSRYLARRTETHMGKGDVALLRDATMILRSVKDRNDMVSLGLGDDLETEIAEVLRTYRKNREA
jgi:hypothetical protein